MKLGPEDERLILSLWARGWSPAHIANHMNGGPAPELAQQVADVVQGKTTERETMSEKKLEAGGMPKIRELSTNLYGRRIVIEEKYHAEIVGSYAAPEADDISPGGAGWREVICVILDEQSRVIHLAHGERWRFEVDVHDREGERVEVDDRVVIDAGPYGWREMPGVIRHIGMNQHRGQMMLRITTDEPSEYDAGRAERTRYVYPDWVRKEDAKK